MKQTLFEELVNLVAEGIYVVDRDRRIQFWNTAAESITGYTNREAVGQRCADGLLRHCNERGEILCGAGCPLTGTMEDGQTRNVDAYFSHRNGRRVPVKIRSAPVRDLDGNIVGCVEFFVESSPLSSVLAELRSVREIADLDPLTGVGNRRMIRERLAAFGGKRQTGSRSAGVIFFDIDEFKNINDTFGHDAGDRVIIEVAHTAAGLLRSFDTLGRWGGDEFVVIVPGVDLHDAAVVAERLRAMVTAVHVPVDGREIGVTISAGVTVINSDESGEDAMTRADHLMYTSKDQGRNRITAG